MIVFDLDGVAVNFCKAAYEIHGKTFTDDVPTKFDFFEDWGMTAAEFWKPIDTEGANFWKRLEKFSWTEGLIAKLTSYPVEFVVATSPSTSATCTAGKVDLIKSLFHSKFRDYCITPRKWYLSCPGRILIDDSDENCKKWEERGGRALLFPQPWNKNSYLIDHRISWLYDALEEELHAKI